MEEKTARVLAESVTAIAVQLGRLVDLLEARDKAEDQRREEAEILSERIAEAEARRKHQQRYAP